MKDSAFLSVSSSVADTVSGLPASYLDDAFTKNNALSSNGDNANIRKLFQGIELLGPCMCYFMLSQHMPDSPVQSNYY